MKQMDRARSHRGYTLVEMLVASFVFVLLGMLLVQTVKSAVDAWRTAEARREVYERAQLVLGLLTEDLASAFADNRLGADTAVRFQVSRSDNGSSDLRFVRRIAGELNRPLTRSAGEQLSADAHRTLAMGKMRPLLAGEGLEEVFYVTRDGAAGEGGAARTLWRGLRSPIGGGGSLFLFDARAPAGAVDDKLPQVAMPLVGSVLFFGIELWDPRKTLDWELPVTAAGGPANTWDSVARVGVFPELVKITLVLAADPLLARGTRLAGDLAPGATELRAENIRVLPDPSEGNPFILIDGEWIRYRRRDVAAEKILELERGQRGTVSAAHKTGARIEYGYSFTVVTAVRAAR